MKVSDHMPFQASALRQAKFPRSIDTYRAARRAIAKAHYRWAKRNRKERKS